MSIRIFVLLCACFSLGLPVVAAAQEMAGETASQVPQLTAFHEVVFEIWHTAYPAKDAKALRALVPRVNELAGNIYTAKLPGILRDKEDKWKTGVAQFKSSVEAYNAAAKGQDDQALLNAAEALHARYEALVRTINPVLKEMDAFHQSLYVVYHTYLADKAYDKIRGSSGELVTKAEAITKASLPKSQEAKSEALRKAAAELLDAARALDAAGQAHDHAGMEKGVENLHARYQALEALFG
jgi:hypothetical protein